MNIKRIANNNDLADYLQQLGAQLRSCDRFDAAERTLFASQFATGSASEFLFEAEEALKVVHRSCADVLSEVEIAQVVRVLKQIREAFDQVGGVGE